MPFIHVKTNVSVNSEKESVIKTSLGKGIETLPGKSEQWLMLQVDPECHLWFQGSMEPAAMVEVAVYGTVKSSDYNSFTKIVCQLLHRELNINQDRIYVKYSSTTDWGWNGQNF